MVYSFIFMKYANRIGKKSIRKYNNDTSGQQRLESIFKDISR
jgi:hypothetical protein